MGICWMMPSCGTLRWACVRLQKVFSLWPLFLSLTMQGRTMDVVTLVRYIMLPSQSSGKSSRATKHRWNQLVGCVAFNATEYARKKNCRGHTLKQNSHVSPQVIGLYMCVRVGASKKRGGMSSWDADVNNNRYLCVPAFRLWGNGNGASGCCWLTTSSLQVKVRWLIGWWSIVCLVLGQCICLSSFSAANDYVITNIHIHI